MAASDMYTKGIASRFGNLFSWTSFHAHFEIGRLSQFNYPLYLFNIKDRRDRWDWSPFFGSMWKIHLFFVFGLTVCTAIVCEFHYTSALVTDFGVKASYVTLSNVYLYFTYVSAGRGRDEPRADGVRRPNPHLLFVLRTPTCWRTFWRRKGSQVNHFFY